MGEFAKQHVKHGLQATSVDPIVAAQNDNLLSPATAENVGQKLLVKLSVLELRLDRERKSFIQNNQFPFLENFVSKSPSVSRVRLELNYYQRLYMLHNDGVSGEFISKQWNDSLQSGADQNRIQTAFRKLDALYPRQGPSTYDPSSWVIGDMWDQRHAGKVPVNVILLTSSPSKINEGELSAINQVVDKAGQTLERISSQWFGLKIEKIQSDALIDRHSKIDYLQVLKNKNIEPSNKSYSLIIDPDFSDVKFNHAYYWGQGIIIVRKDWLINH